MSPSRTLALTSVALIGCADPVPFPPTAVLVANSGDGTLTVVDAGTERVVGTLELDEDLAAGPVAVSTNRKRVAVAASAEGTSTLFVIDPIAGEVVDELDVEGTIHGVQFTSDDKLLLYTVSETKRLNAAEPTTLVTPFFVPVGQGPRAVTLSPETGRALVANIEANTVSVVDLGARQVIHVPVGRRPTGAWIGVDGNAYVTNEGSSDISVLSIAGAEVTATIDVGGRPSQAALRPDGKLLYVVNAQNRRVQVFELPSRLFRGSFEAGDRPRALAFAHDGLELYVADEADKLHIVETNSNQVARTVAVGKAPAAVAFWRKP